MAKSVVISRSVRPEWLDRAVKLVSEGKSRKEIEAEILDYLSLYIKDKTNLFKTRSIIMKTWVDVGENTLIRDKALEVYKSCSQVERIGLHWAMLLAEFPIFKDLCVSIGKLSDTQDEISLSQIKRRVFEQWGERTTLLHSIPKNIKTVRDFGILEQVKPGIYKVVQKELHNSDVALVLLYVTFKTSDKLYHSLSNINKAKELFAFNFDIGLDDLNQSNLFRIDRIGGEAVISI